mmetsp:Transcript_20589/g.37020  ORF Transcript_20589/g.37020 Transcript_20589/m.37020 type:complete len:241 (-) Transcript_20589:81-803(-)|eukprot:CAMPEP_0197658876 /NCGR_PEP_ID=MMETSP1338-20131121/45501_1 /TAXON_ID=43686 ORGANISM="Pelagodinium beii, Strain RCC1491" /NCGR_SAMPLE_ID=MMETSP1338 /ASSEMBLY_ACC=CAM_ASM_000754 /LENGTH=240 /DNA_ID=CAMNT_0043235553 /DNA_START=35 /DNA_END=757 /DNA_ORIENTATION=-
MYSLGPWVEESSGKRRQTGGRAGAVVQLNKKGQWAEVRVISVLHLSLKKPVLKTFDRVKVQKRCLHPFKGTATCSLNELTSKFVDQMSKFGMKKNEKGKPVRCCAKVTPTVMGTSKGGTMKLPRGQELVTPTKGASHNKSKSHSILSGEKTEPERKGKRSIGFAATRSLQVIFKSAADVKDDNATYNAAMEKHGLKVSDWKPTGQPNIVDATGKVYKGKPSSLDTVVFPLMVAMKLTKVK